MTAKLEEIMFNNEEFATRQPRIIGEEQFRKYAVMAPLIKTTDGIFLLFEKRTNQLRHHPGEICFPGGKLETEESLQECAVRETMEELLVRRHQIDILGPGDVFLSPFNIMVHPFIGVIKDYQDTFSKDEVEEIIKVPLSFFHNQQPDHYESRLISKRPEDFPYEWIPGGENYPWANGTYDIYFYKYENIIIWGMTAHMIKSIVELIEEYNIC